MHTFCPGFTRRSKPLAMAGCSFAHLPNFLEDYTMPQNPILEELRKTREELLANSGGTMAGLVARLQDDERKSGREVLDLSDLHRKRRTNRCTGAAKSGDSTDECHSSPPGDRCDG